MIHGKKGFIVKLVLFVIIIVVVVSAFWSFFSASKNTAKALVTKPLEQYNVQGNSYIHPDLDIPQYNFWKYQFESFILAAAGTNTAAGKSCYGTFHSTPDFEELDKWTLTLSSQENSIYMSVKDERGTIGAYYKPPTTSEEGKPDLRDIKLCIRTADGKETDVKEINILFGEKKSWYYTFESLQGGNNKKTEFYYQPYLKDINEYQQDRGFWKGFWNPDDKESNLFFFTYSKEPRRLCITPIQKKGDENSMSFDKIKELFIKGGFPEYESFCDVPKFRTEIKEGVNLKQCFYTPCDTYSGDNMRDRLTEELKGTAIETSCGQFSLNCGKICLPEDFYKDSSGGRFSKNGGFECATCAKYIKCGDIEDDAELCNEYSQFCNSLNCQWDAKEKICMAK
ncbi:hypothetical protein JW756_02190 [Candidatus Woesearchaeota archaeon]|nr:hypothetical protein [Candidatus Woesearchaeota archaeon]